MTTRMTMLAAAVLLLPCSAGAQPKAPPVAVDDRVQAPGGLARAIESQFSGPVCGCVYTDPLVISPPPCICKLCECNVPRTARKVEPRFEVVNKTIPTFVVVNKVGCPCKPHAPGAPWPDPCNCGYYVCPSNGGDGGCPCSGGKVAPPANDGGTGDLPNRGAPAGFEWKRYPGEPWKLYPIAAPAVVAPRPFPGGYYAGNCPPSG